MDFHRYPIDEQLCEIKFESFGYTSNQVSTKARERLRGEVSTSSDIFALLFQMKFEWLPTEMNNVNPNITLDQFEETIIFKRDYATDYYDLSYSGLILHIRLSRKIIFHLVQTYIPSFLFVSVAWLSLFINPEVIPGRVSMVMMTLLTLMAMFSGVRQSVPKVSGAKFGNELKSLNKKVS